MSAALPELHVIRHGETAWPESRQHTDLTDIPLTERGERQARRFGEHLRGRTYGHVFTRPRQDKNQPVVRLWNDVQRGLD
jgi:probable phosphoglycerate mutase